MQQKSGCVQNSVKYKNKNHEKSFLKNLVLKIEIKIIEWKKKKIMLKRELVFILCMHIYMCVC